MLILWRETVPGRKPAMAYSIPKCFRNGIACCYFASHFPNFDFHYRRANLRLRRADVTSNEEKPVENSELTLFSAA